MPNDLGDSTARLQRLLEQIISERDPDKCDQLGAEIWRVLNERDRASQSLVHSKADKGRMKRTSRVHST
jgi:hypothetical protein